MLVRPVRLGVLAALLVMAACELRGNAAGPATPEVTLERGTTSGEAWVLTANRQSPGGPLCLELAPDPERATASTQTEAGTCGFNGRPTGGYWFPARWAGGRTIAFGPVPASAVTVRLADGRRLPTTPLPPGHHLPEGRYWVAEYRTDGPYASAPLAPQPLDAAGHPVAFTDF